MASNSGAIKPEQLDLFIKLAMTISQINDEYLKLWDKFAADVKPTLQPMQYAQFKPGAVVFVGINPSYSESGWEKVLRGTPDERVKANDVFAWPNANFNRSMAIALESHAHRKYSYFKPMRDFAAATGREWLNIDLFAWREKSQQEAKDLLLDAKCQKNPQSFCNQQLELFDALIEMARPSAVVVVNALAASIYHRRRPISFNRTAGHYEDRSKSAPSFPVHFSGMLTGGRALDVPSRDRLFWSVARSIGADWTPEFGVAK